MALAYTIGDKVEAAYRRGDLFEKRRRLMDEWGKYCGAGAAKKVGKVTRDQIRQIAEVKMRDLNAHDLEAASQQIEGTARSMGIEVV